MKIKQIYEGWKNNLFPSSQLKEIIKEVSKERMSICDNCEFNSKFHKTIRPDVHCIDCGCTLSAKTKCLSCDCPLENPKWKAVVTEQQEEEMMQNEKSDENNKD
jgi:hypothetical protein